MSVLNFQNVHVTLAVVPTDLLSLTPKSLGLRSYPGFNLVF